MTSLILTDRANPRCVLMKSGRAQARLWTRLRSHHFDRSLAAGASPDSSAELSLRARALIGTPTRLGLARSLRTVVTEAQRPPRPLSPCVPVCRRKILRSNQTLEELVERLTDGGPVDARGVAQLRLLLADGCSPVYHRPAADDLEPALRRAIDALEVRTQA